MAAMPLNISNPTDKPVKLRVEPSGVDVALAPGDGIRIEFENRLVGHELCVSPDGEGGVTVKLPAVEFAVRRAAQGPAR